MMENVPNWHIGYISYHDNQKPEMGRISIPVETFGQLMSLMNSLTKTGLGGKPTVLTVGCRTQAARRSAVLKPIALSHSFYA